MSSPRFLRASSQSFDENDEEWLPITPTSSDDDDDDSSHNGKDYRSFSTSDYMSSFMDGVQNGFFDTTPTQVLATAVATTRTTLILVAIGFVRMGRETTLLLHHAMIFCLSCLVYLLQRERNSSAANMHGGMAFPATESSSPRGMMEDEAGEIALV